MSHSTTAARYSGASASRARCTIVVEVGVLVAADGVVELPARGVRRGVVAHRVHADALAASAPGRGTGWS